VQISVSGVVHAIDTIKRYAGIREKVALLAERLCKEVGEPIIKQIHGNHSKVWSEATEKGYKITAEGKDVLFIEFGAGDAAGRDKALYDEVPSVVRPGSWSEKHAQMYSRFGFWVFAGRIVHEVPTSPAFYYAYEAMVQAIPRIASEVFK